MLDPDFSEPNKPAATLAILSGAKVMVWDLSSPIGDNGDEPNVRAFDSYPQYEDGVPISSLAWNHNQMVIATSSGISTDAFGGHDNIVLLSSQGGQTLDSFQHDSQWKQKQQYAARDDENNNNSNSNHHPGGSAVKSISFGGKSRYLCIGDESGAVCLWDLKKKIRVRQFFHTRSGGAGFGVDSPCPSHQVSLDPTDTYVLSLSPSALYQYNLRDGQLVGTLKLPNTNDGIDIDVAHFTVFSISDLEMNLCAIGADDGSIYIHDITNHHFKQHEGSSPLLEMTQRHSGDVTGLAFSPVYPDILFSCGSDGMILVHNKSERSSQKIRGALDSNHSSIQSMSLHANGVTCAVGCQSGDVFVYDFFQNNPNEQGEISTTLLASFQANEPIRSLFFAPPPRPKDKQRQSGKNSSSNNENNSEGSSRATSRSTTIDNAPMDSTPSRIQSSERNNNKPATAAQQTPVSPTATESKSKAGVASPFAKRLAALASISKPPKQQKAVAAYAGSSKRTTEQAPLSPKKLPSSPVHKYNNSRIRPREPTQKAEQTNVSRNVDCVCRTRFTLLGEV
jgi:WD40 repeat protein